MEPGTTEIGPTHSGPSAPWWSPLAVLSAYILAVLSTTWPFATTFSTRLPSTGDPLQHLWVMRWYKQCLLEWRSPLVCPDLQYPVGAPLGNFSPLHLQSFLYLIASSILENDVLCFNLIWLFGLLFTGMGTYVLARHVLRDEGGAFLAGLFTMLSGPVLVHSHAHLELVFVGGFPLFMLAWMRFVDRPTVGRMLAAALGFLLVAICAAYFMVFAIFPAALYLVWKAAQQPRSELRAWSRSRIKWSLGVSAACLPFILVLFAGQVSNMLEGQGGIRSRDEFDRYGAPWWGYFIPSPGQVLQGFLPLDPYAATGIPGEGMAYLGLFPLLLVARAWMLKLKFRDSGFWWLLAGVLVVLSLGSTLRYAGHSIQLPAGWLRGWDWFLPFRLIRVPARFKLFVPVCTGIIAGAAWIRLRSRWPKARTRRVAFGLLVALSAVDLAHVPYYSEPAPALPQGYSWLREHFPEAAWVDVPQMNSGNAHQFNSMYTYWQSLHGGRTTAGYSGHQNRPFDDLLSWNSPFSDSRMMEASFPGPVNAEHYDLIQHVDFRDYAWLYLQRHDLRFVVLHRWAGDSSGFHIDRMIELLQDAICYNDGELVIVDRDMLATPELPIALGSENWGGYHLLPKDGFVRLATRSSEVDIYNPDASEALIFAFEAKALSVPRRITLLDGPTEIWSWDVSPGSYDLYVSPPFHMNEGRGQLRIESDGVVSLDRLHKRFPLEFRPASMVVKGICFRKAEAEEQTNAGILARGLATEADQRQ